MFGFGGKTEEVTVLKKVIEHPETNDADAWGADQWSELKQYKGIAVAPQQMKEFVWGQVLVLPEQMREFGVKYWYYLSK